MFSELLEDECPFLLFKGKGENKKWQRRKKCVHQRITSRVQMLRKANPDMEETAIPVELVTCSGSGLDQHISPAAAKYQVTRIAKANNMSEEKVGAIIEKCTDSRFLGVLGEKTVNVLKVNLMLDGIL